VRIYRQRQSQRLQHTFRESRGPCGSSGIQQYGELVSAGTSQQVRRVHNRAETHANVPEYAVAKGSPQHIVYQTKPVEIDVNQGDGAVSRPHPGRQPAVEEGLRMKPGHRIVVALPGQFLPQIPLFDGKRGEAAESVDPRRSAGNRRERGRTEADQHAQQFSNARIEMAPPAILELRPVSGGPVFAEQKAGDVLRDQTLERRRRLLVQRSLRREEPGIALQSENATWLSSSTSPI